MALPQAHALPPIWVLVEKSTGEPSFVRSIEKGTDRSYLLGPFAYTKADDAQAAASHPGFFPAEMQNKPELVAVQVAGTKFIEDIVRRFPQNKPDVFSFNEGLFPLTESGAAWVDTVAGKVEWAPLFEKDQLVQLNRVLALISSQLGVETIRVQATNQEERVKQCRQTILQNVKLIITPEPDDDDVIPTFWVHTMGMAGLDRPDLELRKVPALYAKAAGGMINSWAAFSLDHPIKAGEMLMDEHPMMPVVLRAQKSVDPFWMRHGLVCLELVIDRVFFQCGQGQEHGHTVH